MTSKNSGIGRIVIPSDFDRESYIRRCYDTGRVSIMTYGAGLIRQASVAKHCMNDLDFPLTAIEFGSPVVYNKIPRKEEYIIYAVLKEIGDVSDLTEYQFSVGRKTADGISKIAGDADDGSLTMTVNHNVNGGTLTINVGNGKTGGSMTIDICGAFNTDSDEFNINAYDKISFTLPKSESGDTTTIEYIKGNGFSYSDEFGNKKVYNKNNMQISPVGLFNIGYGKEQLILGNTFKKIFDEHTDIMNRFAIACSKVKVNTPMGDSTTPLNGADFIQIAKDMAENQQKYIDFLSTLSNTD